MVPSHLISGLATAANSAINNVLQSGAQSHGQATPTGEVGFVAAFVLGGVPAIANAWRPILQGAGYSLKMHGVFCHQTPKATFADSHGNVGSCELADLLVVVDDISGGNLGRRLAVLVQAKMAARRGGQTLSSSGDLRQLDLISRWPAFTLPKRFAPGPRDFLTCHHPGSAIDCARYGLIDQQPKPFWHVQAPAFVMPPGGHELGSFLAHMLKTGQVGYGREATGLVDDWSRTVNELMTVTYTSIFNYSAGFSRAQRRGQTALMFATLEFPDGFWPWWNSGDRPPPSDGSPEETGDEGPGDGISMLRIGISREGAG